MIFGKKKKTLLILSSFMMLGAGMMMGAAEGSKVAHAESASYTFSQHYSVNTNVAGTAIELSDVVTLTCAKGVGTTDPQYYTTGTALRAYYGNTLTFSSTGNYVINSITLTIVSGGNANGITADVGSGTLGTNYEWVDAGEAYNKVVISIGQNGTANSGHRRISAISVSYTELVSDQFKVNFESDMVALKEGKGDTLVGTSGQNLEVTLPSASDFENDGYFYNGTAQVSGWKVGSNNYSLGDKVSIGESTTFTAVYEQVKSDVSVTEALGIVSELSSGVSTIYSYYCEGFVSSIPTAYDSGYGNITVMLSDGNNEIMVYRMSGGSDVEIGDTIKVYGTLVNYGGNTPEFNAGTTYEIVKKGTEKSAGDYFAEGSSFAKLTASYNKVGEVDSVVDSLDTTINGNESGSSYTSYTKTIEGGATYSVNSANTYGSIQLRSTNNAGIVTTVSAGKLSSIKVTWNSNTASRTLEIYGKNSAYESPADLYDASSSGELIGSISYDGTSSQLTYTYVATGDYEYIGLKSKSSAMYIDAIEITYVSGGDVEYTVTGAKLGFGAMFKADAYDASAKYGMFVVPAEKVSGKLDVKTDGLSAAGYKAALESKYTNVFEYERTPVKVDAAGNEAEDGEFYQIGVLFNSALENKKNGLVALGYMELDGQVYVTGEISHSLESLAQHYKDNGTLTDTDANGVLDAILAYGN